jgi:hypothetical protein
MLKKDYIIRKTKNEERFGENGGGPMRNHAGLGPMRQVLGEIEERLNHRF